MQLSLVDVQQDAYVRVLGPVEFVSPNGTNQLGRRRERQIAAILASDPGRWWSTDDLIRLIWGEDHGQTSDGLADPAPANPRRTVQTSLSRLRQALDEHSHLIETVNDVHRIGPEFVDSTMLAASVESTRALSEPSRIIDRLERAVALWQGDPFANIGGVRSQLSDAAKAAGDTHAEALLMLAAAYTADGKPETAAAIAAPRVKDAPLDERWLVALATALGASGRKTAALHAITELRQAMREVGLDVGEAVARLEGEIIDRGVDITPLGDTDLSWGAPSALIGRQALVNGIMERLTSGKPCLLMGESGVGKTLLLRTISSRLNAAGQNVLSVQVRRRPGRPMEPIAALMHEGRDLLDRTVMGDDPGADLALQALLDGPATATLPRPALIYELGRILNRLCVQRRVVICVDDFHLLDGLSRQVFAAAAEPGGLPMVAAAALRLATGSDALGATDFEAVRVPPFGVEEVQSLIDARYPRGVGRPNADQLHSRSGGNALFLSLMLDLHSDGALDKGDLPPSLVIAARRRLDALSDRTVTLLGVASAMGASFLLDDLETVTGSPRQLLEDAAEARLIIVSADATMASFQHGLVSEVAYDMLVNRADWHERIAETWEERGASPIEYARHYALAAELDPARAAAANLSAGRFCLQRYALEDAIDYFVAGRELLTRFGIGLTRTDCEMLIGQGRAERLLARPEHLDTLHSAARLADDLDDTELLAKAVVELSSHGGTTTASGVDEPTIELIALALSKDLPGAARAEILAAASTVRALSRHSGETLDHFCEAMRLAQQSDDPECEARVLTHAHLGLSHPDGFELRGHAARRLTELAGQDLDLQWEAAFMSYWQAVLSVDVAMAREHLATLRLLTPSAQHRVLGRLWINASHALLREDVAMAEDALNVALDHALTIFDESWVIAHYSAISFRIHDLRGTLEVAGPDVERAVSAMPQYPNWRAALALIASETGDRERAEAEMRHMTDDLEARTMKDITWTGTMLTLARVATVVGDPGPAAKVFEALRPHSGRMSFVGACSFGPIDAGLAGLATVLGDAAAHRHHQRLADQNRAALLDL